jgi:hypothetical protein
MESLESEKYPKISQNFCCELCDYTTSHMSDYETHCLTGKHLRKQMETEKYPKISQGGFYCDSCNFTTLKKSIFDKHNNTIKHLQKLNKNTDKSLTYCCDICNKEYLNRSGLYKHKKSCQVLEHKNEFREQDEKKPEITVELVLDLIKQNKDLIYQNKDLQTCLMESHTKIVELTQNPSTINNTTNNTTNQQFNLNVFLNETCKDAMNITDFVNSLQLTTKDFENTGKVGFIEGITQIILNRLNNVDTTKRPMHCTDSKRETLYIKDDNVWEKEDDKKTKFKKVVNQIANKNLQQLNKWKEEHPDCIHLDTPDNIDFRKYYRVALGGETNEEDDKFFEKIKRNILKEIVVNKSS